MNCSYNNCLTCPRNNVCATGIQTQYETVDKISYDHILSKLDQHRDTFELLIEDGVMASNNVKSMSKVIAAAMRVAGIIIWEDNNSQKLCNLKANYKGPD